jgi:hypothetical protein
MGMGRALYPWVWVQVKFYTHQLYRYGYDIALPAHTLPIAILIEEALLETIAFRLFEIFQKNKDDGGSESMRVHGG